MGDKVSKMKNGISKNLVRVVEFDETTKNISTKDVIELYKTLVQSGNTSVSVFKFSGESLLTDEVAKDILNIMYKYNTNTVVAPASAALPSAQNNSNNSLSPTLSNSDSVQSTRTSSDWKRRSSSASPPAPVVIKKRQSSSLSLQFLESDFGSNGVDSVLKIVSVCDFVHELVIEGNYKPLEMQSIETLGKILLTNSADQRCVLTRFHLGKFAISQQIASEFMSLMNKQRKITHLSLSKWQITPVLLRKLLIDKETNDSRCVFEVLDLTDCEINNECCKVLAECLKTNTCLTKLVLCKNKISDVGVNHLIGGIEEMNSECRLQVVDLQDNEVDLSSATVKAMNSLLNKDDEKERRLSRDPSLRLQTTSSTPTNTTEVTATTDVDERSELSSSLKQNSTLIDYL